MKFRSRYTRFTRLSVLLLITLATLALFAGEAAAILQRVGPINTNPPVGNFPAWYQDNTGITLEFCDPKFDNEVAGGWCLLLPGDVPNPPEAFPGEFFDEHFYFAAGAILNNNIVKKAILVLAVESAFSTGAPVPGAQVAFARIRVDFTPAPANGTYRFIHPYGEEIGVVVDVTNDDRIFITDDVGIGCPPGHFEYALTSRLGPFLLPSLTAGGDELAAIPGPVPGKLYIADPGRIGPVTGSSLPDFAACPNSDPCAPGTPTDHNIFRIEQ